MFLYIFKIIIKLIMTSSRFNFGSTSKTLSLSLLLFNERSGSENLTHISTPKIQNCENVSWLSGFLLSSFCSLGKRGSTGLKL